MRHVDVPWPRSRSVSAVARNFAVLVAAIAVATVVALAACTDTVMFAEAWDVHGSVAFTSSSGDSVAAEMVMVNRVRKALLTHGRTTCPPTVDVEARPSESPSGEPVWEYGRDFGSGWACVAVAFPPVEVAPGDSIVYRVDFPVSAVLGDSLPAGPYAFTGVMLGLGATDAGTYRTVELGTLTLGLEAAGPALADPPPRTTRPRASPTP